MLDFIWLILIKNAFGFTQGAVRSKFFHFILSIAIEKKLTDFMLNLFITKELEKSKVNQKDQKDSNLEKVLEKTRKNLLLYSIHEIPELFIIGESGVDLFFLISGFVMVAVTHSNSQSKYKFKSSCSIG